MKTIKEISAFIKKVNAEEFNQPKELIPGKEGFNPPAFAYITDEIEAGSRTYRVFYECCGKEQGGLTFGRVATYSCPHCGAKTEPVRYAEGSFVPNIGRVLYSDDDTMIFEKFAVAYKYDREEHDEKSHDPEQVSKMTPKFMVSNENSQYYFFNKKFGLKKFKTDKLNSTEDVYFLPFEKFLMDKEGRKLLSISFFCEKKISDSYKVEEWSKVFRELSEPLLDKAEEKRIAAKKKRMSESNSLENAVADVINTEKKSGNHVIVTDEMPPEGTMWNIGDYKSLYTCKCGAKGIMKDPNGYCPHCEASLRYRSDPCYCTDYVKVAQTKDKDLVLLMYTPSVDYKDSTRTITLNLSSATLITLKATKDYTYNPNSGLRSVSSLRKVYGHNDVCINEDEAMEIIKSSSIGKTGFAEYVAMEMSNQIRNVSMGEAVRSAAYYMKAYRVAPVLELITKTGMRQICLQICSAPELVSTFPNPNGTSPREIFGLSKGQFKMARENDFSVSDIQTLKGCCEYDASASSDDLIWAVTESHCGNRIVEILKEEPRLKLKKIREYLELSCYEEQCINTVEAAGLWLDYIRLGRKTGAEYRLFPFSLKKEHDVLNFALMSVVDKKKAKIFDENIESCKKFEYSFEDYFVKAPDAAEDLIKEGISLNHSVAQHIGYVADKMEYILFIRKKEKPEESFYTVELTMDKRVIQVRGMSNRPITDDSLMHFVQKWAKAKKLEITSL